MGSGAIVVTGASGALGRQVAVDLVADGRKVVAVARKAESVEEALKAAGLPASALGRTPEGGAAWAMGFDVASREDWRAALASSKATWPRLTGAVLTAGGYRGGSPFHETPDETWRAMFEINLETARVSLASLLPELISAGGGSVVLVSSRAAVRPWEASGSAAYAAAKAGLVGLAQAVASEVLAKGVRVNVILPSTIDTPDNRRAMPNADATRWVAPTSVSAAIRFLLSDAARDVSGAVLPVYGRA